MPTFPHRGRRFGVIPTDFFQIKAELENLKTGLDTFHAMYDKCYNPPPGGMIVEINYPIEEIVDTLERIDKLKVAYSKTGVNFVLDSLCSEE